MAYQEKLSQWILSNAKNLNLKIIHLDWTKKYFEGLYDLVISIEINSEKFEGRGADYDKDIALLKGFSEAIERFVCKSNHISSIGVAAHYNQDLAKENALFEFIERYSIAYHLKNGIGMKRISTKEHLVDTKQFGAVKMQTHQFLMKTPEGLFGVFAIAEGSQSKTQIGGIMGAAVCETLEEALNKSLIECLRNVSALSDNLIRPIDHSEFEKIERPTSADSQGLLFNHNYCKDLMLILESVSNDMDEENFEDFSQMTYQELKGNSDLLSSCPLYFVRCLDKNQLPAPDTEFVG
jgi:ribosomal protein S12 methylthiotransferase accessory factor YcaO